MSKIVRFALAILISCFVLALGILLFGVYIFGGYTQDELEPALVPTAEYLMQNPMPTPRFIQAVWPEYGTSFQQEQSICANIAQWKITDFSLSDMAQWTRLSLNGHRLSIADVHISQLTTLWGGVDFCTYPQLKKGLHIIQIQFASTFNEMLQPDPTLSYTWAFRVE